ncbi:MAG: pyridoxal phosphate-dependent aminotransferase [Acidobacteria bacterium]|nr:pyridoxal phosphate-dependent aminotransferase [Acidobacteriota bacterium]
MPALVSSRRAAELKPTAVNSILAEVRKLRAQGANLVSLMRGEPDFRTPANIIEAANRALGEGRTGYPDNRGEPALREAVASRTGYDPSSEILITTGATFGIYAALMALIDAGDEVLLPDPIYDAYQSPIRLAGGVIRCVPSSIAQDRFRLDPDELEAACTPRTKVLLLNTPWNPTGAVLTRQELEAIGGIVCRRKLALLSDEIYESIVYNGHRHVSPAALSPELRARTIVLNSFSKTYAMTGWRVGYCCAPAAITQAMFLVLQQSSRGPATFVQDAAAEALRGPQDCVEQMRLEYARRRAAVCERLAAFNGCRVIAPEGGFFAMLDIRALGRPSNDVRRHLLEHAGVVVVHGAAYGPAGEGTLRVSFASGGDTLAQGLERLRRGLE